MRALFTTQPALGHLHPLVPLARAVARAGHDVCFATSASFCEHVAAFGFEAIPAGLDWLESRAEEQFGDVLGPPAAWGTDTQFRAAFVASSRSLLAPLRELIGARGIDVVVHESNEVAAVLAAELEEVPSVAVGVGCKALDVDANALALWERARSVVGLPPDPAGSRLFGHLYLDLHPRSLHGQPPEMTVSTARPIRWETVEPVGGAPASLGALGRRDVAYVTLGTVFNRAEGVFDTLVGALSGLGLDLVVTTGDTVDPNDIAASDDVVVLERFIPDAYVLPKADLVVCHAGYNTMVAALLHGLPMVCLPLGADQHHNAFRAAAAGAAVVLDRTSDEAAVRAATCEVRSNPIYRANAERLRDEIAAMPHVSTAVGLLDQVLEQSRRGRSRLVL